MKPEHVKTVGELIEALSVYKPDTPVLGTWEGIVEPIRVYTGMVSDNGLAKLDPEYVTFGPGNASNMRIHVVLLDCDC